MHPKSVDNYIWRNRAKENMKKEKIKKEKKKISKFAMGEFLSCVKDYKTPSILTALLVAIEVVFDVFIPVVMSQILNVGMDEKATEFTFRLELAGANTPIFTVGNRIHFILICGAIMLVFAILALVCGALSGKFAAQASTGFGMKIRQKLFYKIEQFSFSNLDNYNTASIVTRLTTDVNNIQFAYMMIIRTLVRAPLMLSLALTMAILIQPELSISFAVAMPILAFGLILGISIVFPRFEKMLKKYDQLNETTQENLIGVRAVKAFVREDHEIEKFTKVSATVQKLQLSAEKVMVTAFPLMNILVYACIISIIWFGGNNIIKGDMAVGDLSAFLNYVMQIMMSLMMVAIILINVVLSRASMQRIGEIFDEVIDIADNENSKDIIPADGSIDFCDVDFSYSKNPDVLNLENIDLHIKSGETIGIIGGTGSAKTTLVQLIPRLYDTFSGEVKVGGVNVKEYKLENLRNAVGMVLQKNVLFSGTIRENLLWGNPDATEEEMIHATKVAQAHDFIMSFPDGYETELGQGGVNVSGGQKQRLTIARALLKRPKVMILDDSTSAVDTATDASIRAGLKEEFADTTVLIIAQRIASVEDADRIIIMNNGKIEAVGSHQELIASNPIYQDIYNSQKGGEIDG